MLVSSVPLHHIAVAANDDNGQTFNPGLYL
jgi:hypothetical protein